MNKRVLNTATAIIVSLVLAAANLAGLYYLDTSIGPGNVQVIETVRDSDGRNHAKWSMGIIPELNIVKDYVAQQENMRIWARPGDYSGHRVMGITFALAAIMWFVWIGLYLGFPGNMALVRQRFMGLGIALVLTVLTNLAFVRMTVQFSNTDLILGAAFGYLSIGLNAGGLWYITLLTRLGIGRHESRPIIPASHMRDEKISAFLMSLVIAFIIETVFRRLDLALPGLTFDFVIWAVTIIAFFNYYGYIPAKWLKGERPFGLMMVAFGTVLTMLVWIGIQHFTGGIIGSALMTPAGSQGLSLMLSFWLLFWLTASNLSGKTSPIKTR